MEGTRVKGTSYSGYQFVILPIRKYVEIFKVDYNYLKVLKRGLVLAPTLVEISNPEGKPFFQWNCSSNKYVRPLNTGRI